MRTELVTGPRAFARLEPAWRSLEAAPGLLGIFHGYAWQREWWQVLGGGRALRILVAREGAEITGILPLYEERRQGARCLSFIGSPGGGGDYLDALCRDDATRAQLLFQASRLGADLLELEELSAASPAVLELLAQATEAGDFVSCTPRFPCPFIGVRGSFSEFLQGYGRRENLRRRQRWFASQPGFQIRCETGPEAVPLFLDSYLRLHAARWRAAGGSQAFPDGRLVEFQRRVIRRLAEEGRARLWSMAVAGQCVAAICAFEDRGRSLFYQSGFQPEWGARSAGLVLFARYVEDAFDRGLSEIDLLHGDEEYKLEWTGEARQTVAIRRALSARGRAALWWRQARRAARDRVRRVLPRPARLALSTLIRERRMRGAA